MSGDVQPRKRKDKRRKKEGTSVGSIHEPVASHKFRRSESDDLKLFDLPDQGEKIHVQNEHGVGGNICVKIIFFCLFGLLVGAVGLIYMKSQGSTDVDLPTIEESRFAEYFTGWLDDSTDGHEHETVENNMDHDEHDENEEHDEHDDHDEQDDHDEDEDEHEHENDEEDQQDAIFKLFGLHTDEAEEVEEHINEQEVTGSESGHRHDVDEDEEDEEEEEEEKNEMEDTEEDDDDEEEEKNKMEAVGDEEDEDEDEDDDEKDNKMDDTEEDEEEDNEMENEKRDKDKDDDDDDDDDDNDSGVDLEEQDKDNDDNDEDEDEEDGDDDDDNLSQMDEEDEDKYRFSQLKSTKVKSRMGWRGKVYQKSNDDDDDDDDDKDDDGDDKDDDADDEEEEELSKEEQSDEVIGKYDDYKKAELETDELEKNDEDEEVSEEKHRKHEVDTDDLGFDEIDVSEEDLETEDDQKEKDNDNDEETEHQLKDGTKNLFTKTNKENSETESGIEEEETEADAGGVAIKLGVGIALIIVAHLVLVKKWKSMNNVPSDENVPIETACEKMEIENLHSSVEPVISRRQTLVPENVFLNDEPEEGEMEDEEEEEEEAEEEEEEEEEEQQIENDEEYSEEEEFKKSKSWGTFEKPSWNIKKDENEEEDDVDNEEVDDEEEYEEEAGEVEDGGLEEEEEEEEEVEDDEEDYEEEIEDDVEDDNDVVKQKPAPIADKRQEEIKEPAPIPPPRSRTGRGGHEVDEDSIDFEPFNEEAIQDGPKADDEVNNNLEPEEQKTPEKKVGSEDEWAFRQELDFAEEQFENNPKAALETYDKIISKKPTMIRALIGRAKALDRWAEKEKSNAYLKQAINAYKTVLFSHGERLDDDTYVKLSERCVERMRFAGNFISAIEIHKALILKYPNNPKYRNALAVTYLMLNKIPQARVILNETLSLWPENGFALVHYGFILKTSDNNMEEGAKKLMAGIKTREEGVIDGMFFFHLGDALNRLGREKEAMTWYELGVKEGLFLSKYQRSLYNVNRLKGQPWWTKEETTYQDFFKKLEDNWREIRREGLELLNSRGINLFKEEAENLKDTGDWKQLDLYFRGRKQANCNKAPITCSLVSSFKPAATCTRGQIKFSVMLPNTHVWPHCGPTNCRLRSHLGLVVPKKTFIRVAEETRSWEEGKFIIFDDSFEHEVWHNGTGLRLVLIVDVWHPELTNHERRYLSPI